ncbi:hypothetical protein JG687_00015981 [Phytophthora cactorum]|uniref:Uncharacterized protein n=1 Tax=Phytophthora cactorum TaxID=29920 RepID=A0A329SC63_9STRA|nr:hypothetical protein Pcac1_g21134 [Phytophthora cactorum]KAG2834639.1 hypothetical protein PC111_g5752 [Phytophthora cactorum]KAG2837530.1 hypothetical protein PC112_g4872 [Phytophthora cactorum]KAG2861518.1 hypothetical protein PC113_g7090 [Phytophthora cactorum]KAG2922613.1 hypothetical protein PC114_g5191 [Phytophthora cactorum]
MRPRYRVNKELLGYSTHAAIQRVVAGEEPPPLAGATTIPYKEVQEGTAAPPKRPPQQRDPAPLLPAEAEQALADWGWSNSKLGDLQTVTQMLRKASEVALFLPKGP